MCDRSTPVADGGQDVFAFTVNIGSGAPSSVTFTPSVVNFNPTTIMGSGDGLTIPVTSADLAVSSESASPSSSPGVTVGDAVAGGTIDYSIGVDNSAGPSDGQSFTLQDVLPHGATLVTGAPTTSGCHVTTPGGAVHGDTVQCPGGALAAGTGSASFTIRAKVASSELANSTYTDAASLLSQVPSDPNGTNDTKSVSVNLVTRADLAVSSESASPSSSPGVTVGDAVAGGTIDYSIGVDNSAGPSDGQSFTLQDVLPHGATLVTGAPTTSGCHVTTPGGAVHGDTVQCPGGALAAGTGSASFTIRAKVASSELANSTYTDAASLLSQVPSDPNGTNDTKSVSVNLVTRADLAVSSESASPSSSPGCDGG